MLAETNPYCVLILAAAALPVLWAAITDLRRFQIPNECSLALVALYPLFFAAAPTQVDVIGAVVTAAAAFAITFALYAWGRLGGGDVKLISALALWAGPALIADFVVVTTVSGALLSILFLTRAKYALALALDSHAEDAARDNVLGARMPYGLAIACGGLVVLFELAM